jgi:hypothetical protein
VKRGVAGGVTLACLAALLLVCSRAAFAQTIAVSGSPGILRISTAIAGSEPAAVTNSSTTYTVVTPAANRTYKITAQLNAAMPAGTTLTATFAAPNQATSMGAVVLDLVARDVVTAIRKNTNTTQMITYQFSATAAAGVVVSSTRTVTLTVVQVP